MRRQKQRQNNGTGRASAYNYRSMNDIMDDLGPLIYLTVTNDPYVETVRRQNYVGSAFWLKKAANSLSGGAFDSEERAPGYWTWFEQESINHLMADNSVIGANDTGTTHGPPYFCACVPIQCSGDPGALGQIYLCCHHGHERDGPRTCGILAFWYCTFPITCEKINTGPSIQLHAGYDPFHGGSPALRKNNPAEISFSFQLN